MTVANITREFKELPIGLIDPPELPSRTKMSDEQMDALVASIRQLGLQQPIGVYRDGERFKVIFGHRRRIACERAGLVGVPCFIYPSRDSYTWTMQAHENTKREELSAADEALWFSDLLEKECGGDIDKLAGLVGEKVSYCDHRLALFSGFPIVFDALQTDRIKIGVAHALNKSPDAYWAKYYLDLALRHGATVAMVEGWLLEHKRMFSQPGAPMPAAAPLPGGMPADSADPLTCYLCQKNNNKHLLRHLPVHQHCQMAILDPLLGRESSGS